jgi:hypothetical protein
MPRGQWKAPGHPAFAIELANVAQVDEDDVVATVERERVLRGQGLDHPFGGFDQPADVRGDVLRHGFVSVVAKRWWAGCAHAVKPVHIIPPSGDPPRMVRMAAALVTGRRLSERETGPSSCP